MENPDYLRLDGRQLRILLTIHSAGSLSTAARMLGMTQSTVSYWLEILRKRFGDPLFVRAGNGVVPTEYAQTLLPKVQEALRNLESIFESEHYDAAGDAGTLSLAGSAVDRERLLSEMLAFGLRAAPRMSLRFSPTGSAFQVLERLRDEPLDFALLPEEHFEAEGIVRRKVYAFEDIVLFDANHPLPPDDIAAFCARPQVRVSLGPDTRFGIDTRLAKLGLTRHVALEVGDFDTAVRLVRGTPLIATLPDCFVGTGIDGLSHVGPPWSQTRRSVFLYWHSRHQTSARHAFWRDRIVDIGGRPR